MTENRENTVQIKKSWIKYGFVALVAAMVLAPVAVSASHTFNDVPDTHIFHDDIAWMSDNGITSGCTPTEYCPGDNVTRGQMAKFLRNVAENKVVDAATADTADHATTADSATEADNADTLDGKSEHSFQPALFSFAHEDGVTVSANGVIPVLETSISTTAAGSCGFLSFPQSDILVRATGAITGMTDGETATLNLVDNGSSLLDTTRQVEDSNGAFAMEWLFSGDGGVEIYGLEVSEFSGDDFTVSESQITAEVVQDTRCETIIVIGLGDGKAESPDLISD